MSNPLKGVSLSREFACVFAIPPTSPFARKVRVAAALVGIPLELDLADTLNPDATLRSHNPLGKIPILLREGKGPAL